MLTIEDLLASGKLAPVSARRFEDALQPAPAGDALRRGDGAVLRRRANAFRQLFVDLMERERLDALLYPANQARPHTHEGGLERYGGEPGTCEESAMTGLAAGHRAGRIPRWPLSVWRFVPRPAVADDKCSRSRTPTSRRRIIAARPRLGSVAI